MFLQHLNRQQQQQQQRVNMVEEIDPSVIQRTQQKLGKYIQRPQLTDKLLKRPPFRFIHDIITAVSPNFQVLFKVLFHVLTY